MTGHDTTDERWLSEAEAADFLRRASQLDAGQAVRLRHVREAAVEAGLSVDAVNDAAEEIPLCQDSCRTAGVRASTV